LSSIFYLKIVKLSDEKARYADIYHFTNPFRFEMDTEEMIKIDDSLTSTVH